MVAHMDLFTVLVAGGLLLTLIAFVALGVFYPGSGADVLDWRPTRSPETEAELEADDVAQMLAAGNERRRRRGAPELTEDEIEQQVRAEQEAQRRRRAALRDDADPPT